MAKLIITYHDGSYNEYNGTVERLRWHVSRLEAGETIQMHNEFFDYEIRSDEVAKTEIVE